MTSISMLTTSHLSEVESRWRQRAKTVPPRVLYILSTVRILGPQFVSFPSDGLELPPNSWRMRIMVLGISVGVRTYRKPGHLQAYFGWSVEWAGNDFACAKFRPTSGQGGIHTLGVLRTLSNLGLQKHQNVRSVCYANTQKKIPTRCIFVSVIFLKFLNS